MITNRFGAMMRIAIGTVLTLPIRSSIYHQLSILIFGIGGFRGGVRC
jgi:hypothetical protein